MAVTILDDVDNVDNNNNAGGGTPAGLNNYTRDFFRVVAAVVVDAGAPHQLGDRGGVQ